MSIEDDIFDVEEAVKGTSAQHSFDRLQQIIPGSAFMTSLTEILTTVLKDHVQNTGVSKNGRLSFPYASDLEYTERLQAYIRELNGVTNP